MYKEYDEVKIIKDVTFEDETVKAGTIGIILSIESSNDKKYYIVELYDTKFESPVFDFSEDQIEIINIKK